MQDTIHKSTAELFTIGSITVENQTDEGIDLKRIAQLVTFLRAELGLSEHLGVDVTFVSEEVIEDLHLKHMNEPGPTDVLSFPMDTHAAGNTPVMLGDIVICPDFARRQLEGKLDLGEHLEMLVTHSMLHLIGQDHPDDKTRAAMFSRQDLLLAAWQAATPSSTKT
jgi:probable rRNA maturation factor